MPTIEDRFWAKVDRSDPDGCWIWTACVVRHYGQFGTTNGKRVRSHRFAYELLVGPIPDGLHIDHLCRNPLCVNPAHLEAVTPRENTMRGVGPTAQNAQKVACPQGHPLSGDNLYVRPTGARECRTCDRAGSRRFKRRRAAK